MRSITIPESEYNQLVNENNSLREFVNVVLAKAPKLNKMAKGPDKKGPNAQAAIDMSKMTRKELSQYFARKIK